MKEATADLWMIPAEARVITTNGTVKPNGECVMGRGCALEAKQRYPWIPDRLGFYIKRFGNRPFVLYWGAVNDDPDFDLLSFPVKHNWWEPADLNLIRKSAQELVAMADRHGWQSIVVPRPGCGNGQLDWAAVKPVLETIFDDRFTVVSK